MRHEALRHEAVCMEALADIAGQELDQWQHQNFKVLS